MNSEFGVVGSEMGSRFYMEVSQNWGDHFQGPHPHDKDYSIYLGVYIGVPPFSETTKYRIDTHPVNYYLGSWELVGAAA